MFKKTFFLFLIISTSFIKAQNLYELYKKYLPAEVKKTYTEEMINKQLLNDAAIEPSLLYARILYYNAIVDKNYTENLANIQKYIRSKSISFLLERNSWIEYQLVTIELKLNNVSNYKGIYNQFKNAMNTVNDKAALTYELPSYNKNLDYFYQFLYYTGNIEAVYNENVDYYALCKTEKKNIAETIKKEIEDYLSKYYRSYSDIIKRLISNWFIVKEYSYLYPPVDIIFAENEKSFTVMSLDNYLRPKEKIHTISFGYSKSLSNVNPIISWRKFPDILEIFKEKSPVDFNKIQINNALSFKYNYRFYLNDSVPNSTFLNLGLWVSFAKYRFDDGAINPSVSSRKVYNFVNEIYFTEDFNKIDIKRFEVASNYSIALSATLPVFYLFNHFYLDLGVFAVLDYCKYSADYNLLLTTIDYSNGGYYISKRTSEDKKNEPGTSYNINVFPLVSINYTLLNILSIELFYNINVVGLNAGISF